MERAALIIEFAVGDALRASVLGSTTPAIVDSVGADLKLALLVLLVVVLSTHAASRSHRCQPGARATRAKARSAALSNASSSSRSGGCLVSDSVHQIPTFPLVQASCVTVKYLVPGWAFTRSLGSQCDPGGRNRT
jgi:hypothetical protein